MGMGKGKREKGKGKGEEGKKGGKGGVMYVGECIYNIFMALHMGPREWMEVQASGQIPAPKGHKTINST